MLYEMCQQSASKGDIFPGGCQHVEFDGIVSPAPAKNGKAPYEEGMAVTFECPDQFTLVEPYITFVFI